MDTIEILLADGNQRIQDLASDTCAKLGYHLTIAESSEQAVERLSKHRFDLLISESESPEIDGICLLNMAKVLDPDARVMLLSDPPIQRNVFDHLRNDLDDIIWKPLDADELQFRTARCIELKQKETVTVKRHRDQIGQLYKALEASLSTLAHTVESRDPYMKGHQKGVSEIAESIALALGLDETHITGVRVAGSIHDIGKISVPVEILNKPEKLNDYEYELVKNHPQVGYDITQHIDFPWPVAKILQQHHERWDGSGYPEGLEGENILIGARILSVADVVEAMSAQRPFRSDSGIDKGMAEIKAHKGIFYDPEVVEACLGLFG